MKRTLALLALLIATTVSPERPAVAEPETIEVAGLVHDESGHPVADAVVHAWPVLTPLGPYGPGPLSRAAMDQFFVAPSRPSAAHTTRTDASGRYALTGLPRDGHFMLEAVHPKGDRSGWSTFFIHPSAPRTTWPIILQPVRVLKGRVADERGNGLRAFVSAYTQDLPPAYGARPGYATARPVARSVATDEAGGFSVRTVAGADARLDVFVPGVGRRNDFLVAADDATVELLFETGGDPAIVGRVTDEKGAALAGARVVAFVRDVRMAFARDGGVAASAGGPLLAMFLARPRVLLARTDAEGRYRLGPVFPGAIERMAVSADGFRVENLSPVDVPVSASRPWRASFRLSRGRSMRGHVSDESGKPVAGAEVSVYAGGLSIPFSPPVKAVTDESGAYVLRGLPLTQAAVKVQAEGFYWEPSPSKETRTLGVWGHQLPAGRSDEVIDLDLKLTGGRDVVARVVDGAGKPVAGATAMLSTMGAAAGRFVGLQRSATSDVDGRLTFRGLPPLDSVSLHIGTPGFLAVSTTVEASKSTGASPVQIALTRGGTVRGRVVDADGQLLAGIPLATDGGNWRPVTEASGRFELLGVPPGKRQVFVDNAKRAPSVVLDITVDKPVEGVTLTVRDRGVIGGQVVDEAGRPLPGIPLVVRPAGQAWGSKSLMTDARGNFRVTHMPDGAYEVHVLAGSQPKKQVGTGTLDVRLVLQDSAPRIIEGVVLDESGVPVVGGRVRVSAWAQARPPVQVEAPLVQGRFRLALPHGSTRTQLHIDPPAGFMPLLLQDADLEGGPLKIRLERAKGISGTVVDLAGKPVSGYLLVAHPQYARRGQRTPVEAVTDAEGRFTFVGLTAHGYRVMGQESTTWARPRPVQTQSGAQDVRFEVGRFVRIVGTVQDDTGKPVPGSRVSVMIQPPQPGTSSGMMTAGGDRCMFHIDVGADGRFEIAEFPPGFKLKITARPPEARNRHLLPYLIESHVPDAKELALVLPAALAISGRVTDEDGKPIRGAKVRTYGAKMLDGSRPPRRPIVQLYQHALTDEDGRYELRPFPPGVKFLVTAEGAQGRKSKWFTGRLPDVVTGTTDADFKLPVGQVVRGVVEGLSPAELKDCSVIAYVRKSQVSGSGFDGTSNKFEIRQLRRGKVTLRLHVKKRNPDLVYPKAVEVEAPTTGVRFAVSRAYDLRVKIVGADPKQAQVRFYAADGTRHSHEDVIDGHTFEFRHLRDLPGTVYVVLPKGGGVAFVEHVRPSVGRIEVEPQPTQSIRGRITGLPGKLKRGRVLATRGPVKVSGSVSEDGGFRIRGLATGSWTLTFDIRNPEGSVYRIIEGPIEADAGEQSLILTWKAKP